MHISIISPSKIHYIPQLVKHRQFILHNWLNLNPINYNCYRMPRFCSAKTTILRCASTVYTYILYTSTSIQVPKHTLFNILTTSIKWSYIVCPEILHGKTPTTCVGPYAKPQPAALLRQPTRRIVPTTEHLISHTHSCTHTSYNNK